MNGDAQQLSTLGWTIFSVGVFVLLMIDLWAHRGGRESSRRWAIIWTIIWIVAGLAFVFVVWWLMGAQLAQEYLAAYFTEKSLSLDNLFVFLVIFTSLGIPHKYQHKVLFWGIFGAIVFRGLFIWVGSAALQRWDWVTYIFGAILIVAAIRTMQADTERSDTNPAVKWLSRHLPVTHKVKDEKFVRRENGKLVATPLLIALIALEITDIFFAVDSVPAAFSMTENAFVVYSSNVWAILGLRALYIVVAEYVQRLSYLHYGLALVLAFAGAKMFLHDIVHVPPLLSVGIITLIIGAAIAASLWWGDNGREDAQQGDNGSG